MDVPKRSTQTGKQHKAQEEEEVYSCPQKSQHGLSSQSFPIPWESTTTHLQVCTEPFGSWNLGPDNSMAKCESKVIALFALGILQIHLAEQRNTQNSHSLFLYIPRIFFSPFFLSIAVILEYFQFLPSLCACVMKSFILQTCLAERGISGADTEGRLPWAWTQTICRQLLGLQG